MCTLNKVSSGKISSRLLRLTKHRFHSIATDSLWQQDRTRRGEAAPFPLVWPCTVNIIVKQVVIIVLLVSQADLDAV